MTVIIILLAFATRIILFNQSLWLDEAIQAQALMGQLGPIMTYALADFQPPLYHLLLLIWTNFAGFSEIALRTPSLIAGVGTVYLLYRLGVVIASPRLGRLAAILAATNPLLIYYSQEGRTYMLTTFFVTASFYFLFSYLRRPTRSSIIYHSLFIFLAIWTSYLSWILVFGLGIYWLWQKNWKLLTSLALPTLTLLFWLPYLLPSVALGFADARTFPNWAQVVGGAGLKPLALTWVKMNLGRISFDNKLIYSAIVGSLALVHLVILKKTRPLLITHHPLFIWLLAPIILGTLFSFFVPVYSYTRVLFVVPSYLLLLAMGLTQYSSKMIIFCLVSNFVFLAIFWTTPRFHREDWRGITRVLNAQTNIQVALPSLRSAAPLNYYGLTHPLQELFPLTAQSSPLYYIRYGEAIFDSDQAGIKKLRDSGYTLTQERVFTGIALEIYENRH